MSLPSPKELGLPTKFVSWRKNQEKAIMDGLESDSRFVVQVQRSGRGKTLTTMTQAHLSGTKRVALLTANKGLQDQFLEEWSEWGLVDIRGKSSYSCDGLPDHSCEEGSISKCVYKGSSMCGHNAAMHAVKEARVFTTNYTCWIAANRYSQGFGQVDMLICDEAHNIPLELAKAMRIQLSAREMETLKREWPEADKRDDMEVWKHWAAVTNRQADVHLQRLKSQVDKPGNPKPALIKEYRHMKNLTRKLADIATCKPERWIMDEWQYGYQFDPIEASAYAERLLFRGIERIILTSGTVRPKTTEMCGLAKDDFEFFDYPSEINPERSPLIHIQTGVKVNRNSQPWELAKLVKWIDKIIDSRLDRKGIIHTANFVLRDFIMENSKYGPKHGSNVMDSNYKDRGDITSKTIEKFKLRPAPAVLVSPSVTTGYDFPYDACRYQIIAKLPYGDIGSKIERARIELDKYHAAYNMMQSLAQAFGRGDRADDDMQEVFVLDDNIGSAMWRFADLAPSWLPAYFRTMADVPPPLEIV